MPRYWYDYHAIHKPETDDPEEWERYELNRRIVADRKPYFMRYVYPTLNKEYKKYMKAVSGKAVILFGVDLDDLIQMDSSRITEDQRALLDSYYRMVPVGTHDCTMNRICRRVEQLSAGIMKEMKEADFDCGTLKAGVEYKQSQFYAIKKLFEEYTKRLQIITIKFKNKNGNSEEFLDGYSDLITYFRRNAFEVCLNEQQLTDIVVDLCYKREKNKSFVWNVVGTSIVEKMLEANGGYMMYPIMDPEGDFEYMGDRYSMTKLEVTALYGRDSQ